MINDEIETEILALAAQHDDKNVRNKDKVISSCEEYETYTNKNAVKYIHDLKVNSIFNEDRVS